MLAAALFQGFIELSQQFLLMLAQLDGCLHCNVAIEIARIAGAYTLDTLAAETELLASLRALGNIDGSFSSQRRYVDFATQ